MSIHNTTEITIGLESCVERPPDFFSGASFGLLMNHASVDRDLRLSCDVLNDAFSGQLKALFSPQHGLWGDAQANMIETDSSWHDRLGVPIHSLYSRTRRPSPEMLEPIDFLVIDLQDVGTRVYTFIWTMLECMRACADVGVRVLVLDRPNPLGGNIIEGPFLQPEFQSFVGGASIPMRHGLTIGEVAKWLKQELSIDVDLDIVELKNWNPKSLFDQCDRCWLPPSPNLPTFQSALVYPGQVLLEGTNLSEGRGTTKPFEVIGAPFIDPESLLQEIETLNLPAVKFLPTYFQPTFDKWQNEVCGGVTIHVTDAKEFRSFQMTVEILKVIHRLWPNDFKWLGPPYEYEDVLPPIDIIYGGDKLRDQIGLPTPLHSVDAHRWNNSTLHAQIYAPSRFIR